MPKQKQLFLGLRRENGQIGYLSEGLSLPEFSELIRPKEGKINVLVDFSPVIEALHANHEKVVEQSIREKYNSVFNYWQESNSYSNMQIKVPKFESLSILSNELINSFQFRIDKHKNNYGHRRTTNTEENYQIIKAIEIDINAYIDVLLCFIHSKASLEIASFKKDVVLTQYCDYIHNIVSDLFYQVVEYSRYNNQSNLDDSSLLYTLAFSGNENMSLYTQLLPSVPEQDLRLAYLGKKMYLAHPTHNQDNRRDQDYSVEIEFRRPHAREIEMAKILRDLFYKVDSISKLLVLLKDGNVNWDPSEDSAQELKELIEIK